MAEPADTLRLAELASARLCHDFAGLIGTLGQAFEAMSLGAAAETEAIVLGRRAAADAAYRLRLMRAAWGPDGGTLDLSGLRAMAAGLIGSHRIIIDDAGLHEEIIFPPPMARMVLNLLLMANDSLPAGGRIILTGDAASLFILIEGQRAAWPPGLALCLVDEAAARAACSDASGIQMPLTVLLARALGVRLSFLMAPIIEGPPPLRLSLV